MPAVSIERDVAETQPATPPVLEEETAPADAITETDLDTRPTPRVQVQARTRR